MPRKISGTALGAPSAEDAAADDDGEAGRRDQRELRSTVCSRWSVR